MLYLGGNVTPLIFVEVTPVLENNEFSHLSVPFVKNYLLEQQQGILTIRRWIKVDDDNNNNENLCHGKVVCRLDHHESENNDEEDIIRLPTLNNLFSKRKSCPCWIVGYAKPTDHNISNNGDIIFTQSTLVRILPNYKIRDKNTALFWNESSFRPIHASELPSPEPIQELEDIHEQSTIQSLKIRMSMLLENQILIGSTKDAVFSYKKRKWRSKAMQQNLEEYMMNGNKKLSSSSSSCSKSLLIRPKSDGSIVVHSPHHGAGKTLLVQKLAKELDCLVHIVEAAPFLSAYGINADAALESLLHSIVFSAAVRQRKICVILDHLPAFAPTNATAGDASTPVLVGMASHLKMLTMMVHQKKEFPFPHKNPLYNVGGGENGDVLKVQICIVGIATCSDRNKRTKPDNKAFDITSATILHGGVFRLPEFTTEGRIQTMLHVLKDVRLTKVACLKLPSLVASRIDLRGSDFARVRLRLLQQKIQSSMMKQKSSTPVTVMDLNEALNSIKPITPAQYEVVIFSSKNDDDENKCVEFGSSVGGNVEAKIALQDALALDFRKRDVLKRYGMSPPSGVLLYGPPGTGKTLLARAVAQLLNNKSSNSSVNAGVFFSLQASDIVTSEVGKSEKELVSVFETARANAPAVIFIDEFQALFTSRGGGGSRLTSTLLHCMDDVNRWVNIDREAAENHKDISPQRIVIIGATNIPWTIDKSFLRAGRFDRVIHVGLPTIDERRSILSLHVQRMKLRDPKMVLQFCDQLASRTDGFSGADIEALCRAAAVRCLLQQGEDGFVENKHFFEALKSDIEASSSRDLVDKLLHWKP